ncbi:MAG: YdbL family protein [Parvularculaceae bacterium]
MKKTISLLAAAAFLVFAGASVAASAAIESAKAQCIIGEQADGYIGIVDSGKASAELKREVESINMQRKAAYADLAERNGVTVEAAAQVTAERMMNQAPPGHCIRGEDRTWYKKP